MLKKQNPNFLNIFQDTEKGNRIKKTFRKTVKIK